MYQIVATVDGRHYTGRGFGEGMIYRGRRVAAELAGARVLPVRGARN